MRLEKKALGFQGKILKLLKTGDKMVENVNEKISEGITETGDNIKSEIVCVMH